MNRLLDEGTGTLQAAGVLSPRDTARQLLAALAGCRPHELHLKGFQFSADQKTRFRQEIVLRSQGVPLQYLVGTAGFYGRSFLVGPGVFIPRPETEILVETTLSILDHSLVHSFTHSPVVLDVGTGCGAIAVTLALENGSLSVWGVDRSWQALSFSKRNALQLGAAVSFVEGDLLQPFSASQFDLIAANLPYLNPSQWASWPKELHWEPWISLAGGTRGLDLIRRLMADCLHCLRPGGWLIMEIGDDQQEGVGSFLREIPLTWARTVHDLNQRPRAVVLQKPWKN